MKVTHMVAFLLVIVGGLNWLILGVSGWDIGQLFGGQDEILAKVIYILVGLAAIYEISTHKTNCKACADRNVSSSGPMPTV